MTGETTIDGIDYGPLVVLIGAWTGDRGLDVAPEPDGIEENPYYETITFEAAGDVTNAEQRTLSIVRYHQVVRRKSNDKVFHEQLGFWLWDPADDSVVECFTIPRGVSVVASGTVARHSADEVVFEVSTDPQSSCIAQTPFMAANASTTGFSHRVTVAGDTMSYSETTLLDIYDQTGFRHVDENTLKRAG